MTCDMKKGINKIFVYNLWFLKLLKSTFLKLFLKQIIFWNFHIYDKWYKFLYFLIFIFIAKMRLSEATPEKLQELFELIINEKLQHDFSYYWNSQEEFYYDITQAAATVRRLSSGVRTLIWSSLASGSGRNAPGR